MEQQKAGRHAQPLSRRRPLDNGENARSAYGVEDPIICVASRFGTT